MDIKTHLQENRHASLNSGRQPRRKKGHHETQRQRLTLCLQPARASTFSAMKNELLELHRCD